MCGIAGLVDSAAATDASSADTIRAIARAMAGRLAHRGPDDAGDWAGGGVALAQRRLAVVDLSPAGRQPMHSQSGRWTVVFNGEIYNFSALRAELAAAGVQFRGTGDTETLVEAIDRWGPVRAVERSNGMFALAAYDRTAGELVLARDRLGEKPLYWTSDGQRFAFASQLSGLVALPGWSAQIDPSAIASVLRWSFVPHPHSVYRGVHQLPPGGLLRVRPASGGVTVDEGSFWSLADAVDAARRDPLVAAPDEIRAELERLLADAVAMRLHSDVPIGAFLSGGIDSGLVAAFAQRALGTRRLRTFTVSMPELGHDEAPAAARVAHVLGTDHTVVEIGASDGFAAVHRLAEVWDEPFADPSMLPTMLLCDAVRRHVTVTLGGDGGDELFAGYNRHVFGAPGARAAARLPRPLRRLAAAVGQRTPVAWVDRAAGAAARLPGVPRIPNPGDKVHKLARLIGGGEDPWPVLAGVWPAAVLGAPVYAPDAAAASGLGGTEAMLALDTASVLPDQMLVKADRASMAASLELRVPLLDPRLVQFAWRLPLSSKASGRRGKLPLRDLAATMLPAGHADQPKLGFDPPLARWLRGALRDWAGDLLAAPRCVSEGWIDGGSVRRAWSDHLAGRRNLDAQLWAVTMVEAWLRSGGATRPGACGR